MQEQVFVLNNYSQHCFGPIANPSKTLTPKCFSPKSHLPKQTKQAKTFPVLPTLAGLYASKLQTIQNHINIAKT